MQSNAATPEEYIETLPEDRKQIISAIRNTIIQNLPNGFLEIMNYGMLGYVVPHSIYPSGYHCDPKQPLPFLSIASQKNHISIYHMGIYASKELGDWFTSEYSLFSKKKLDIGKSCIRFKKAEDVPVDLIGELASKITPNEWVEIYEKNYVKS
jgi:hypothetical protein